jgi:membrane protease YdiL (CAAX protease family)
LGFGAGLTTAYFLVCKPIGISLWKLYCGNDPAISFKQQLLTFSVAIATAVGIQVPIGMGVHAVTNIVGRLMNNGGEYQATLNPIQYEQVNSLVQSNITGVLWAFAAACVLAPIFEELVFRRLLFTWLRLRWGVGVGIVVSALIFACSHCDLNNMVQYFVIGTIFAVCYARTQNLFLCILLHSTWNLWALGASILLLARFY